MHCSREARDSLPGVTLVSFSCGSNAGSQESSQERQFATCPVSGGNSTLHSRTVSRAQRFGPRNARILRTMVELSSPDGAMCGKRKRKRRIVPGPAPGQGKDALELRGNMPHARSWRNKRTSLTSSASIGLLAGSTTCLYFAASSYPRPSRPPASACRIETGIRRAHGRPFDDGFGRRIAFSAWTYRAH